MRLILIVGLLCLTLAAQAQQFQGLKKYVGSFIKDTADVSKPQLLVYPTLGYSPETNTEIGLNGLLLYYAKRDTTNRLSEVTARTFYTLENQYGAFLEHALYTDKNKWFLLGNLRFQSFPVSFYGIGINASLDKEQLVEAKQFIVRERVLMEVRKNLYAGLGVEYNRTADVVFREPNKLAGEPPIWGQDGFSNLGLGVAVVFDTRHNVLNVRNGYFSELALLNSSKNFGSDYSFGSITSDNRYFKTVRKNQVLAAQLLGQFSWGDVPFNQLPQIGGPNMLRGYYLGRFRDKNLLATQVEYRFLPLPLNFTNRIGAAVFASAGTVYHDFNEIQFRHLKGAAGAGLRVLLFPKKDIYVRVDYALTREGNGFYIYVGEAF